jgi:MFS family permease
VAIGSILCLLGAALQSAAVNVNTFIAGRWLLGFGYGFVFNASAPLLIELAYPKHRALITGLYNTTWVWLPPAKKT